VHRLMTAAAVDYEWGTVVIGADLDAARFAYDNECFLIKNREPYHHSYEGANEQEWSEKMYHLHEMGLVPFVDKVTNLRIISEEKILKIFTGRNVYTVRYDKLYLYDDENVEGASLDRELLHYRVVDWFDCQGLYDLNFDQIITSEKFVNIIKFFIARRIDGNKKYLDLLCESLLTEDQLKNFDYSDTMARLKIESLLKQHGIERAVLTLWKRDIYPVYK